jgi:multicomponent Na+:H+ antiporter subunit D
MLFSFVPGLPSGMNSASAQMVDRPAYAMRVLDGMSILAATTTAREIDSPGAISGFAPITGAIAVALGALFRDRLPFRFPSFMIKAMHTLRTLHSGKIGDYVIWLTLGVGGLGTLLAILLN